jgi:hypothetical protein
MSTPALYTAGPCSVETEIYFFTYLCRAISRQYFLYTVVNVILLLKRIVGSCYAICHSRRCLPNLE